MFHIRAVPSSAHDASRVLEGLHLMEFISPSWPLGERQDFQRGLSRMGLPKSMQWTSGRQGYNMNDFVCPTTCESRVVQPLNVQAASVLRKLNTTSIGIATS
jgi:hypothetical protein